MDIMLNRTFMHGGSTDDMKKGHRLEPLIIESAILDSCGECIDTIYPIEFVGSLGLIANKNQKHIAASPDGIALTNINGEIVVACVEVKS